MRSTSTRLGLRVLGIGVAALAFHGASAFAAPTVRTVNPVPGAAEYTTIAAAVAAASDGDTIQCEAGIYPAAGNTLISLNRPLTLRGAQAGVDARGRGPDGISGQETVMPAFNYYIFALNSAGITIDGFSFPNMGARGFDTYANPDHLTIRNCIFKSTTGNPSGGNIQFGGGAGRHADDFLFERNYVRNLGGYMLYMGHAMDGGTIRDNYVNGESFAFGPFGARTGWRIEGNEFDGNVPGHGAYFGFGVNANLGDVVIRDNYVHQMDVGLGQISVVGGTISGNTFDDNRYGAFQLWGGEWGSVVSADVAIENNAFTYDGAACTDVATASHGIRLRTGLDGSTIRLRHNSFTDLGVGACGNAWAIRNDALPGTTVDADLNWWATVDGAQIATKFSRDVDHDPWIVSFRPDPAKAGARGFWPIDVVSSDPYEVKSLIRDRLVALLPTLGVAGDRSKLEDAIKHLNKSLLSDRWVDALHPKPGAKGESVFNEEMAAAVRLVELRNGNKSGVAPSVFQEHIDGIVAVDRRLAEIALREARARAGRAGKIKTAQDELRKGDVEAGRDHPGKAIEHYRNSWKNGVAA